MIKLLISFIISLFIFTSPIQAQSCPSVPVEPNSPALDQYIAQAQAMGGAAAQVPASLLKAIYNIEATTAYRDPNWSCQKTNGDLGIMQINDNTYYDTNSGLLSLNEIDNSISNCQPTECKLNRCDPISAFELAARVLLLKANLWDPNTHTPTGSLTNSIEDIYYTAGRYYSANLFDPSSASPSVQKTLNNLIGRLPSSYQHYPSGHSLEGTITYAEFVCAYTGVCQSYQDYPPRVNNPSFSGSNPLTSEFTFNSCAFDDSFNDSLSYNLSFYTNYTPALPTNPLPHPLRPNPFFDPVPVDQASQTPYCITRPTAVKKVDIRNKQAFTNDPLNLDFQNFYTPILSITDINSPAFQASTSDEKSYLYLADYLEGREYYELFAEPDPDQSLSDGFIDSLTNYSLFTPDQLQQIQSNPNQQQLPLDIQSLLKQTFLPSRSGVFRQLAPQSYQDQLKIAMIDRATDNFESKFNTGDNPYGFTPSSFQVKDYWVGCWDGTKITDFSDYSHTNPCSPAQAIKLSDFQDSPTDHCQSQNIKPLLSCYQNQAELNQAYNTWQQKDNSKWYKLWPYIPMFTREDSIGYIDPLNEAGQSSFPDPVPVAHPHLARTFEVASTISNTLTPFKPTSDLNQDPSLTSPTWISPAPWFQSKWWLNSQVTPSNSSQGGPVCQPLSQVVSYTGDLAKDSTITTIINKDLPDDLLSPRTGPTPCGTEQVEYECEVCETGPYGPYVEDSACFKDVRYSPTYLKTFTPFIDAITNALVTDDSDHAIFNLFRSKPEIDANPNQDWPAVGYDNPNSAFAYSFPAGKAEAGNQLKPAPLPYLYKALGWIHCQKHDLFNRLLPNNYQLKPLPECNQTFAWISAQTGQPISNSDQSGTSSSSTPGFTPLDFPDVPEIQLEAYYPTGQCPLEGGQLITGSFTHPGGYGHGTNSYWGCAEYPQMCKTDPNNACCTGAAADIPLPAIEDPACLTSPHPGSIAYNSSSSCTFYGFAADFCTIGDDGTCQAFVPVVLPEIDGQVLNWEVVSTYGYSPPKDSPQGNTGGLLRAQGGGNVYEISLFHLLEPITSGGPSGTPVGVLYHGISNPHVHVELRINGEYVKPDRLCSDNPVSTSGSGYQPPSPTDYSESDFKDLLDNNQPYQIE